MSCSALQSSSLFFFHHPPTTEIYTLSLHDALPISPDRRRSSAITTADHPRARDVMLRFLVRRSEEHTSELQSRLHLVCRLLLEKKNKTSTTSSSRSKSISTPTTRRSASTPTSPQHN